MERPARPRVRDRRRAPRAGRPADPARPGPDAAARAGLRRAGRPRRSLELRRPQPGARSGAGGPAGSGTRAHGRARLPAGRSCDRLRRRGRRAAGPRPHRRRRRASRRADQPAGASRRRVPRHRPRPADHHGRRPVDVRGPAGPTRAQGTAADQGRVLDRDLQSGRQRPVGGRCRGRRGQRAAADRAVGDPLRRAGHPGGLPAAGRRRTSSGRRRPRRLQTAVRGRRGGRLPAGSARQLRGPGDYRLLGEPRAPGGRAGFVTRAAASTPRRHAGPARDRRPRRRRPVGSPSAPAPARTPTPEVSP